MVVYDAYGCAAVSRCLTVRPAKQMARRARAGGQRNTQAVLSYAAASAGVTLRRWHLLATDVLIAPMRLAHSRGSLVRRVRRDAQTLLDAKSGRQTFAARIHSPPEASIAPLKNMRTLAQKTRRVRGMLRSCLSARLFIEPGTTLAVERRSTGRAISLRTERAAYAK